MWFVFDNNNNNFIFFRVSVVGGGECLQAKQYKHASRKKRDDKRVAGGLGTRLQDGLACDSGLELLGSWCVRMGWDGWMRMTGELVPRSTAQRT